MTDKQLTQRMREAAEVLEEAANRFYPNGGLGSIYAHWSSDSLTRVADEWDAKPSPKSTVGAVKIQIDLDPPDLFEEMRLTVKVADFLQREGEAGTCRLITSEVIEDERWRGR